MYDDDGETNEYKDGAYVITKNRTNNILLKNKSPNAPLCDIMQLDPDRNVLLGQSEIICAES